jgi:predicted  nucleic acid-binding Zn-ribbon protein
MPYGYGYSPWAPLSKEQEIAMLEDEARALESDLDNIRKRLEELRK